MNKAYLALGSNEGNRSLHMQDALTALSQQCGDIVIASPMYKTAAWGVRNQTDFLNMVVCVNTSLSPIDLLHATQNIEQQMGRVRSVKWGQRTMDIDLLLYNNDIIQTTELTIPHPYLHLRRFVLVPLAAIAPGVVHPVLQQTIQDLLNVCSDELEVREYTGS